ncbi:uncharacterized protein LOC119671297 isoform X2 [Teleopsis dalmanni]|uniref:uncharacterized protein LOC119671297 isoform X2 n=1 Tax=Teleopsis dalmanni TaxID=139649 RepID=UPI0018CEFC0C|nr:uncharacterized protein LOC119671297 isoform X2 [Teleopsis dalmanni]
MSSCVICCIQKKEMFLTKNLWLWCLSALLLVAGVTDAIHDPTYTGIKTKAYRRDPLIAQAFEQQQQQQQQQHEQQHNKGDYYRPKNIDATERLSQNYNNNYNQYQQQQGGSYSQHRKEQIAPIYQRNTLEPDCPPQYTGLLPYNYDCRRFVNCWNGRGHIQSCAPGTVFNHETLECDRPDKVQCGALDTIQLRPQQSQQQRKPQYNHRSGRLQDVESFGADTESVSILCPAGVSGLHPHPTDCTKFLNCANGNVHVQDCGPGTAYSINMMVCDFKHKVDCSGREGSSLRTAKSPDQTSDSAKVNHYNHNNNRELHATSIEDIMCPIGVSGLFPHPFDYTKFINCRSGNTAIQNCMPGTAFSITKGYCDRKSNLSLLDYVTFIVSEVSYEYSQYVTSCPPGTDGIHLYPFDCEKYVACVNGKMSILPCGVDKVYSLSRKLCSPRLQVHVNDRVRYLREILNTTISKDIYDRPNQNYVNPILRCPSGVDGAYPFPFDATKYLSCRNDELTFESCTSGKIFSLSHKQCTSKENVNSMDHVQILSEYSEEWTISNIYSYSPHDRFSIQIKCPPGVSGHFLHPFDCTKFINCQRGQTSFDSCPASSVYSISRKECVSREQVAAYDRVEYFTDTRHEFSSDTNFNVNSNTAERNNIISCPTGYEGVYPHPYDCRKYLVCTKWSEPTIETCSNGLVYSVSRRACDFDVKVVATDRSDYNSNRATQISQNKSTNNRDGKLFNGDTTYQYRPQPSNQDRWTNMNIPRPTTYTQHQHPPQSYDNTQHRTPIEVQNHQHQQTTDWSGVGYSKDVATPTQNVLYVEGSLQPNRNYITNHRTSYSTPLAPFAPNTFAETSTSTTPSGDSNIYYAQPVGSQEDSNELFSNTLPKDRFEKDRSKDFKWNNIDNHTLTSQKHPIHLPNQNTISSYPVPLAHFLPPLDIDDGQQQQLETDYFDQNPSATQNTHTQLLPSYPNHIPSHSVIEKKPVFKQNVYSDRLPTTTMPTVVDETNLFGGLLPPLPSSQATTPLNGISMTQTNNFNKNESDLYPTLKNATVQTFARDPHYSPSYSGVAHSRNTTWTVVKTPQTNVKSRIPVIPEFQDRQFEDFYDEDYDNDSQPQVISTTTDRHGLSPPPYNKQYYKNTTPLNSNNSPPLDTDNLPISDALRILLRPYFNRSGSITDEAAAKAESHIMALTSPTKFPSSAHTRIFTTTSTKAPTTVTTILDDVELIVAGEQHSMVDIPKTIGTHQLKTEFHSYQENSQKVPENIHSVNNWHNQQHSKNFHSRHPELPNPFNIDERPSVVPTNTHYHNHHQHTHRSRQPYQHSREFHQHHPNLPNPFATREGDQSIIQKHVLDIPNPYAESNPTPSTVTFENRFNNDCEFDCGNDMCIRKFEVCDGVKQCSNGNDENNCEYLGYEVRLTGGESTNMGRIEVKILGKWGYVCDDKFGLHNADVVCRELGFKFGAHEVRGNSYYPPTATNFSFAMDEVDCSGNETKLKDCNFKGWGVNNCGPDEVVGIVCKIPQFKCQNNYWLCSTSKECIPPEFVCDNTPDCADKSDESDGVCKSPIEYRLKGGRSENEGRLEVRYRREWGTVCDDDFGIKEAQVVCNSLGYFGLPTLQKNIYGPGKGPIWLDQVSCNGNESAIDRCNHWNWGEHNCNHTEDVGIKCTVGTAPDQKVITNLDRNHWEKNLTDSEDVLGQTMLEDIGLYSGLERSSKSLHKQQRRCGHFKEDLVDDYAHPEERVINGTVAKRGRHPWQATIRTRGIAGISSHWCGAVLISKRHLLTAAHCLAGYQKGAYFIRMGDHYASVAESSEIDSYIENWYIHEKFRENAHMNNDIAVIVLKTPVKFNDYVQPICLPEKNTPLEPNRICTISGWGSVKSGVSTPSNILRAAQLPILADSTCKQPHVYGNSLTAGMFCAGTLDESVDACDGDSGGPLVCSDEDGETLYGIISWGQHCGYINKPGVYVRVEKYIDWIYEKVNFSLQQTKLKF